MELHTSLLYSARNAANVDYRLNPSKENKLLLEKAEFRLGWYLSTGELLFNVRPESYDS